MVVTNGTKRLESGAVTNGRAKLDPPGVGWHLLCSWRQMACTRRGAGCWQLAALGSGVVRVRRRPANGTVSRKQKERNQK